MIVKLFGNVEAFCKTCSNDKKHRVVIMELTGLSETANRKVLAFSCPICKKEISFVLSIDLKLE